MTAPAMFMRPFSRGPLVVLPPCGFLVIDLYCRMSEGDDGTVYKCEDQEAQGRWTVERWAESNGFTFGPEGQVRVGVVRYDHNLSAWKHNVIRHSFIEVMDRLEAGESQGVWFRDVDRFTRKMHEAVRIADLAQAGAHVLSYTSSYDLTDWDDRERFLQKSLKAEAESAQISKRVKWSLDMKTMQRGQTISTKRGFARDGYLYGTDAQGLRVRVPREQLAREQAAVRDAATRLIAGESLYAIAMEWNANGLTTVYGGRWDVGNLRVTLSSGALAGIVERKAPGDKKAKPVLREDGSKIVMAGDHALDQATFTRLQLRLAYKKRGRPVTNYLLSGIARCGSCGATLYGRPEKGRLTYWCQKRPRTGVGCGKARTDAVWLEQYVSAAVVRRLNDPEHEDVLAQVEERRAQRQGEAQAELERLVAESDELAEQAGDYPLSALKVALAQYQTLIAAATAAVEEAAQERDEDEDGEDEDGEDQEEDVTDWANATLAKRRRLVKRAYPHGLFITGSGLDNKDPDRVVPGPDPEAS